MNDEASVPTTAHMHVFAREWDKHDVNLMNCMVRTCHEVGCVEEWDSGGEPALTEWIMWRDPAVRTHVGQWRANAEAWVVNAEKDGFSKGYSAGYEDGKEDYA